MPYIEYVPRKFRKSSLEIIELADRIATSYKRRGFNLTLRQLYYQFIALDAFPNTEQSYNRLGAIINDARLAGLIDWEHIEDRGREAHSVHWSGHEPQPVEELIANARWGYSLDLWEGQERRIEICGESGSVALEDEKVVRWDFRDARPEDAEILAQAQNTARTGAGTSMP